METKSYSFTAGKSNWFNCTTKQLWNDERKVSKLLIWFNTYLTMFEGGY